MQMRRRGSVRALAAADRGAVTAEFAVALSVVALIVGLCVSAVVSASSHVLAQDAAGDAARLAARGDSAHTALTGLEGATVDVWDSGALRCARVHTPVQLAGFTIGAHAVAKACALRDTDEVP